MGQNGAVAPASVPLVGLPFAIAGWQVTLAVVCKCDPAGHPLLVTNRDLTQCPNCRKAYRVQGVAVAPNQHPKFNLAIAMPAEQPVATLA